MFILYRGVCGENETRETIRPTLIDWTGVRGRETDPRARTSTMDAKQAKMHSATQAIIPASPSALAVLASILRA
jgi:hypothetical protein